MTALLASVRHRMSRMSRQTRPSPAAMMSAGPVAQQQRRRDEIEE
jgi:hypothetical protein